MKNIIHLLIMLVLVACKEELIISDKMKVIIRNYSNEEIEATALWQDSLLFAGKALPRATSDIRPGSISLTNISRRYFIENDSSLHIVLMKSTGDTISYCYNRLCDSSRIMVIEDMHEEGGRGGYFLIYEFRDE
ncbi:MAG: hypothetical protein HC842_03275 [Cytophagales bacterium]|nr:hypothetical protein [Cytophagales bacterium]